MKRINIYASALALALAGIGLQACNEDLAQPPVAYPVEGVTRIGNGTWEDPMEVWQVKMGTSVDGHLSNWATGYIVGCIDSDVATTFAGAVICTEEVKAPKNNNVLMSQFPYSDELMEKLVKEKGLEGQENDWAKAFAEEYCVGVQLPSGASRSAVNLADHPENFNKQVSLRGVTGSKYMGEYGLRSAYEFNWGPKGRYEEPIEDIDGQYFCNFSASRDINYYLERGWSLVMESGGLSGWYVREYDDVRYLTCSAYYGSAVGGPYRNWVISPKLDLHRVASKTLSFRSQVQYPVETASLEVYVLTHKNPRACTPVKLDCVISESDRSWVSSGTIDLSQFSGDIYIGFLYNAEVGGDTAPSYNVTDFNFGNCDPAEWEVQDPALIKKYRQITSTSEIKNGGKYALVFDEQYMAKAMSESLSYGRMSVTDVKIDEGTFTASIVNAITFTEVEGFDPEDPKYTLTDYYGRAIYVDSNPSHKTFQLSSPGDPAPENAEWRVKYSGGTFLITNIGRNMSIKFSSSYKNISPESSGGIAPALYEMLEN